VIPLRATHAMESSTVESVFVNRDRVGGELKLRILSKETIVCDAGEVRDGPVEYAYYKIGWG
jgi:hypothetical protein